MDINRIGCKDSAKGLSPIFTLAAAAVDIHFVIGDEEIMLFGHLQLKGFDGAVLEFYHLSAGGADQVVVMLALADRLEPFKTLAEAVLNHESAFDQHIKGAVN